MDSAVLTFGNPELYNFGLYFQSPTLSIGKAYYEIKHATTFYAIFKLN